MSTRLKKLASGQYATEDGRYRVFRDDEYLTNCDEPHPVKLPRAEWKFGWDFARGENRTIKGYQCPGGETHTYTRWNIWDNEEEDFAFGHSPGAFATFKEAREDLDRKIQEKNRFGSEQ